MRRLLGAGGYFWLFVAVVPYNLNEAAFRIILPPYLQSIGFGLGLIGALVALYGVAALVSRLPVGLLYRREHARWIAAGALAIMAGLSILYPLALDPLTIGLLRIAQGLVMGTAGTPYLALFLEARPPDVDRGRANSLYAAASTSAFLVG